MPVRRLIASVLVLACCAVAGVAHAEVTGVKLTLSPYVGLVLWDQIVKYEDQPVYGGRAGLWFGRYIAFEGTYGYCPTKGTGSPAGDTNVTHYGGDLVIHLTKPYTVTPYVLGGWSRLQFDPEQTVGGKQSFDGWEAALGVKAMLADRVLLRLEGRDVMITRDAPLSDNWTHNFIFSAGLDFVLGGHIKDSDQDGITDRHDKCPNTPLGAKVDAKGCPMDSDGDGVFDGLDQCSNTPKGVKVDSRGCPVDSDNDGVVDGTDQCPNTPLGAKVDAKGCPIDGDGDGVPDGIDQCPNTPAGAIVDAKGCPSDSDGDGVYDGIDQCPNTPAGAKVDAKGCPIVVSEKETQLLDTGLLRLNNITFDTGKATLKPESNAPLDEVGTVLSQWPQLQIEIGGHTDSRGSAKMNQELSEARAQSVLDYLKAKFPTLNPSQYTVKGYGESQPVADNKTEMGRSQNRRVEFKVLNREVLKKEIEKRKMLQK
jgi:OmpA-OmpF porin, OOP family